MYFTNNLKGFFSGFMMFFSQGIMAIPLHIIRSAYMRLVLKSVGRHIEFCRNLDVRTPRRISVGSNTTINKRVLLDGRGGDLVIGSCVDIAQDVQIWTLQHDYNSSTYAAIGNSVFIDDYAWIGSRVIILPGVRVGKGAVIAAGAVVTRNVLPYTVVAGIPAKKIAERQRNLSYKLGKWRWFQ